VGLAAFDRDPFRSGREPAAHRIALAGRRYFAHVRARRNDQPTFRRNGRAVARLCECRHWDSAGESVAANHAWPEHGGTRPWAPMLGAVSPSLEWFGTRLKRPTAGMLTRQARRERTVAAAIVVILHGAGCWWLVTEPLPQAVSPKAQQFDLILIPPRSPPADDTTATAKSGPRAPPQMTASSKITPTPRPAVPRLRAPSKPAKAPVGASIDWGLELEREAQVNDSKSPGTPERDFGIPYRPPPRVPTPPKFGWDHARTHRIESVPGAMLIHLGDRCLIALTPFPFPFCKLGKIKVEGDLFKHLHDAPDPLDQTLP